MTSAQPIHILVGGGTCGIAAGAKAVLEAFKKEAPQAHILFVGCKGVCHQEVLVEVRDAQKKSTLYGKVKSTDVQKILAFHTGQGPQPIDLVVTSTDDPQNVKGLFLKQQIRIALRNVGEIDPTHIDEYIARGGYGAIKKILADQIPPTKIIEEVRISGLRGRGGGGFPTATKWQFAREAKGDPPSSANSGGLRRDSSPACSQQQSAVSEAGANKKYLICNGDEGDPGAFMDRSILEGDPHSVLEGMLIAAYAIGANAGYAYIRAEYPLAVKNFEKAIVDARAAGFLGQNILDSEFSFDLKVKQGAGAFVCGEETALIGSIEGQRGMPRIRPPFPAIKGLFGKPTIINNVETLANLPWIIENGGAAFAKYGTEKSKGTKVFALAGAIARGGLVEIPMGMTIREVLYDIGGGSKTGRPIKAVQLGGPSGGCIPRALFDTPIDYDAINATGAIMGSGGMIVMDESSCMVDIARYFLNFTQLESCGKCTFCRIGTLRMKELLVKICDGQGIHEDLAKLEELAHQVKMTSLCGLGQTAPNPVLTTLKYFKDEYLAHIDHKKCPAAVCKKLIHHTIKKEKCTACSICKVKCPVSAITGTPKHLSSFVIDPATCVNCGLCVEVCRFDAILVE